MLQFSVNVAQYFVAKFPIEQWLETYPETEPIILWDPPEIKPDIERWTHVIATNFTVRYPVEWSDETCLREFVQNALDVSEEEIGKPLVDVEWDPIRYATVIKDYGKGITDQAVLMGGTDKPCWMRGYWGEGLKMSVGFLLKSYNTPTYMFTKRGDVYKTVSIRGTLVFVYGISRVYMSPGVGTAIIIPNWKAPEIEIITLTPYQKERILFEAMYGTRECPHERPSRVIDDGGNKLYVAEIFVNTMDKAIGIRSLYTYDLWWLKLHRGRTAPIGTSEFIEELNKLISAMDLMKYKEYVSRILRGNRNLIYMPDEVQGCVETEYVNHATFSGVANAIIYELFGVDPGKVVVVKDVAIAEEAVNYGYTPVYIGNMSAKMRGLFFQFPTFEKRRILDVTKQEGQLVFIPETYLPSYQLRNLFLIRGLNYLLSESLLYMREAPEIRIVGNLIEVANAKGEALGYKEIRIDSSVLETSYDSISVLCHEFAHVYVSVMHPDADPKHVGDYYWRALEKISTMLTYRIDEVYLIRFASQWSVPFITFTEYLEFTRLDESINKALERAGSEQYLTRSDIMYFGIYKYALFLILRTLAAKHVVGYVLFDEMNLNENPEERYYLKPTEFNEIINSKIAEFTSSIITTIRDYEPREAVLVWYDAGTYTHHARLINIEKALKEFVLEFM